MAHSIELHSHPALKAPGSWSLPFAVLAWLSLEIAVFVWGRTLVASHPGIALNAAPLFGRFDVRLSTNLVPAVLVAALVVLYFPRLARTNQFSHLLLFSCVLAFLWAAALAFIDGAGGLLGGLESRFDYLAAVPLVDQPHAFLSTFTDNIASFPVHVQGHPPGMLIFLWALDAIGMSGPSWAAAAVLLVAASTPAAVLLTVRELAGENPARACAPFIVLVPAALWIATSGDALFMGIGAWGIALFAISTGRGGLGADAMAGISGLLLGATIFLSYGLVLIGLIVGAIAFTRRAARLLVVSGIGIGVVVAAFAGLGFWWLDGLRATLERYEAGVAGRRPYSFFVLSNIAAFALALGPAVAVALVRLRDRRLWTIVGAGLLAIAIADLSGLSKGEVERIWLPFVPWIVVATAALEPKKQWLALQGAAAVAVGVLVRTPW